MSARRLIKFFRHATFTSSEWTSRNPFLAIGEIGFEWESGRPRRHKVGPGYWNDIGYEDSIYGYVGDVLTPVNDAMGDLSGLSVSEILFKMLNGYIVPAISNVVNNGGIGYAVTQVKEIGQSLAGPITVLYLVTHPEHLQGSSPINITANGVFSNEGNFVNNGQALLSLASPLAPSNLLTITISVKAIHVRGTTDAVITIVKFIPRIMWVTCALNNMADSATFMSQTGRQSILADSYKRDYNLAGSGYGWVAIPEMLNPTNLVFADRTNPEAPLGFDMTDMGSLSINNGVGTYLCRMLRTTYPMIQPSTLRIA